MRMCNVSEHSKGYHVAQLIQWIPKEMNLVNHSTSVNQKYSSHLTRGAKGAEISINFPEFLQTFGKNPEIYWKLSAPLQPYTLP